MSLNHRDSLAGLTASYNSDVNYDIVGKGLRRRTAVYVLTYDVDIRHRWYLTYDVVSCDVHTHKLALIPCRVKRQDSASGICRKLSIIRPEATTVVAP